jgi:hypothetical protein
MKKFFTSALGSIMVFLLGTHIVGMVVSFMWFSWQYAKEYGFLRWLFLGEIIPMLKAVGWEVFFVLALIQSPSHTSTYPVPERSTQTYTNPVLERLTQNKWWLAEYPALIEAVEKADSNQLSTSYTVLADGTSKVELLLSKTTDKGFILTMKLPKGVQSSIDLNTGEKVRSDVAPIIIIRDHNLDGLPDDFQIEPSGQPLYKEKVTDDGFIIYRDDPEHHVILAQWAIGVGYSINYFLHGRSSLTTK